MNKKLTDRLTKQSEAWLREQGCSSEITRASVIEFMKYAVEERFIQGEGREFNFEGARFEQVYGTRSNGQTVYYTVIAN